MVKTITKYYCDICGKEAPYCLKYYLPDIYENIYHDALNPKLKKEISGFHPVAGDICPKCAELIYLAIKNVKKVVTEE